MRKPKSKTQQRRAEPKPEGFLTVLELAALLGLTRNHIQRALKAGVVPTGLIKVRKVKWYNEFIIKREAAELIKEYFSDPPGFLRLEEVVKALDMKDEKTVIRYLHEIPDGEKFRLLVRGKYFYDPAVLPLLESKKAPKIQIKREPPAGQEWFTKREFIALFERPMTTVEDWIEKGKIPPELIARTNRGHIRIAREAIACISGVIKDYSKRRQKSKEALPPESEEIVELDGYCLTREEHARRLKCKEKGLRVGLIDNKAAC